MAGHGTCDTLAARARGCSEGHDIWHINPESSRHVLLFRHLSHNALNMLQILTESYDTGMQAVDKALLSTAMAPRRTSPVYNFLGSFQKTDCVSAFCTPRVKKESMSVVIVMVRCCVLSDSDHKLLPPADALSQLAATMMARAKPWLV